MRETHRGCRESVLGKGLDLAHVTGRRLILVARLTCKRNLLG
jgi:hypothetical protein